MPALTPENDLIRSRNVTASECYALLGRHPYHSRQSIYDRLSAPWAYGHPEQSEAMALGVYFEPHIARYAARRLGLRIRANNKSYEHRLVSLSATPDYLVVGKRMLLEIKLSGIMYNWNEEALHPWIEWQARAQLACTQRDVVMICALVGVAFYTIPVLRDVEKEERLLEAVDTFFNDFVLPGIRPPDDDATLKAVVTK